MYVDLSYQGRQAAERGQLDNGKLPHGGYKGSKRHPPSFLSFMRGSEFQQKIGQEIEKVLWEEELMLYGSSPSWSLLLNKEPSYTDESPLMTNKLLAASKMEQRHGTDTSNRRCKSGRTMRNNGQAYYRPNSTHQFLSATDLKDCSQNEVDVTHGRPTRTTLLRALHRRHSTSANMYHTKRDFLHRLYDIRNSGQTNPVTESFKFETARDGEPLHSFLTGTRYSRYNPELGCFFTAAPRDHITGSNCQDPRTPQSSPNNSARRPSLDTPPLDRPATVPLHRSKKLIRSPEQRSSRHFQDTPLKLSVIGNNLKASRHKDISMKLPNLLPRTDTLQRQYKFISNDILRKYDPSSVSSSDVQNGQESAIRELVASNSELHVEFSQAGERLKTHKINLESRVDDRMQEKNVVLAKVKSVNVPSVKVPSVKSSLVSAPLRSETLLCEECLNQIELTSDNILVQQTDVKKTGKDVESLGDVQEDVPYITGENKNNEQDGNDKDRQDDNKDIEDINIEIKDETDLHDINQAYEEERDNTDDIDNEDADAIYTEERDNIDDVENEETDVIYNEERENTDDIDNEDTDDINVDNDTIQDLFTANGQNDVQEDASDVIRDSGEFSVDEDVQFRNSSNVEGFNYRENGDNVSHTDNHVASITNMSQTKDHVASITNTAQTEDHHTNITNLSQTEDDDDSRVTDLSQSVADIDENFANLSQKDTYDQHLTNLSQKDNYDEHVTNLSQINEEDGEEIVTNLPTTEDEDEINSQQDYHRVRFLITEEMTRPGSIADNSNGNHGDIQS